MDIKRPELTEDSLVAVSNEYGGTVMFKTELGIRHFEANQTRQVKLKELTELILQMGQGGLFTKNYLVVKDERVRDMLGLEPISGSNLDAEGMIELLKSKDNTKIEEFLQFTSDANLDKFVRIAIELPVNDLSTLNILQAYTGRNIVSIIKEQAEDQVQATGIRKKVDGTAPENAATPLRARKAPTK